MRYRYYISYGNPKDPNWGPDDWKKAFEEFATAIKKYNLKIVFWGVPFGVSEGMVFVLKGTVKNFESYMGDPETFTTIPVTNMKTHFVYEL